MVASCVICLGESGQALAGKRCKASACKKALERAGYTDVTNGGSKSALKRWKEAMQTSANVPSRGLLEADLSSMQAQSASRGMLEADLSSMQGQVPPPKQALSSV